MPTVAVACICAAAAIPSGRNLRTPHGFAAGICIDSRPKERLPKWGAFLFIKLILYLDFNKIKVYT